MQLCFWAVPGDSRANVPDERLEISPAVLHPLSQSRSTDSAARHVGLDEPPFWPMVTSQAMEGASAAASNCLITARAKLLIRMFRFRVHQFQKVQS
jgi:hypothetical protein